MTPGRKALATLAHNGTALTDGDTVTVGSRVYTFKTVLTGAPDEVLIGAATASLGNLAAAINGAAGEGTLYGAGTAAHEDVTAEAQAANTRLACEALIIGTAGNDLRKAVVSANLAWDAGETFTGGQATVPMGDVELLQRLKQAEVTRIETQDAAIAEYLVEKDAGTQAEITRIRDGWAEHCDRLKTEIDDVTPT